MKFWRNHLCIRAGLSCLFTLLLCAQSFAAPSSHSFNADDALINCQNDQDESCVTAERQGSQKTENENAASSQHSSESEKELEEKGEKELEDDKEEMDRGSKAAAFAFNYTVTGNNHLAVTFRAGPIRDVPTPPPNC